MARLIISIIRNICAYFLSEIGVYCQVLSILMPLSHKAEKNALLKQHLH